MNIFAKPMMLNLSFGLYIKKVALKPPLGTMNTVFKLHTFDAF